MPIMSDNEIAVLVLAAGGGSRLGGGKLLLPWRGKPLIVHVVETAVAFNRGAPPFVTIGYDAPEIRRAIETHGDGSAVRIVENPDWEEGQSTSLKAGIAAIKAEPDCAGCKGVMVMLGDQPLVRPATLERLAQAYLTALGAKRPCKAAAPTYAGNRGNPVVLSPGLFPRIKKLQGDVGARNILAALDEELLLVPVDDPGVLHDIDDPEEYAALP